MNQQKNHYLGSLKMIRLTGRPRQIKKVTMDRVKRQPAKLAPLDSHRTEDVSEERIRRALELMIGPGGLVDPEQDDRVVAAWRTSPER